VKRPGIAHWWALVFATFALVTVGPMIALMFAARQSRSCFESIEQPRGAQLPDCSGQLSLLAALQKVPWTARAAQRAHEEVVARVAVMGYLDAAIGDPSSDVLVARFEELRPAAQLLDKGTARLRLDELGPSISTPDPGGLAQSAGDRRSLDAHALSWTQHYVVTRAIEVALIEGRLERAVRLARHYAGRPNTDLRARVAALLCIGGDTKRGLGQVIEVEGNRAESRSANYSRHFGGVRVVIEACSQLAEAIAPDVPAYGHAGLWDQRPRVMALRMRRLRAQYPDCDWSDPADCRANEFAAANVEHVNFMLTSGDAEPYRLELVATIAETAGNVETVLKLLAPLAGEPPLRPVMPKVAIDWLSRAEDRPFISAERYEAAAEHFNGLQLHDQLGDVVAALLMRAAAGYAQRGDLAAVRRCLATLNMDATALVNAALVAGDRQQARRLIKELEPAGGSATLLRAELALPDVAAARPLALKALSEATEAADRQVIERARWLLVAMGQATAGGEPVDSPGCRWRAASADQRRGAPPRSRMAYRDMAQLVARLKGAAPRAPLCGVPPSRRRSQRPHRLSLRRRAARRARASSGGLARRGDRPRCTTVHVARRRLRTLARGRMAGRRGSRRALATALREPRAPVAKAGYRRPATDAAHLVS